MLTSERPSPSQLEAALSRFGHSAFLKGQREAIDTLFAEGRLLLVAPTGGGKSLTYQLPAGLLPGTTLVVSPLIALMHDQVAALQRLGVPATYLASTLAPDESARRLAALARGEYSLVYVAPERLALAGFRRRIESLDCPLLAIDEAHCISQWGHDFRPDYLALGDVVAALPDARVLACTATATPIVRDEILARLGLPGETPQIVTGFARPNLSLRAQEVTSLRERHGRVDAALAEALGGPGEGGGKAIVYSITRKDAEKEAARLADAGWRSAAYHAGFDGARRERVQRDFSAGALDLVVATNAFGMGIDEPDVRAVVHLGPPGSLEAYYQEVGRAGRDGKPALGLLLHRSQDLPVRKRLLELPSDGEPPSSDVIEHKWNLFRELMRWAEGGSCRHDAILRYFADEAETLAGCGVCDECRRIASAADGSDASDGSEWSPEATREIARKALSGVARVHGKLGVMMAVKLLRGEPDDRLERLGLHEVSTFGVLKAQRAEWLRRLIDRFVVAGWVDFVGDEYPLVVLTDTGLRVMRDEVPARIVLPPSGARSVPPAAGPRAGGKGRRRPAAPSLDPDDAKLFDDLRQWRLRTAKASRVPPYVVAADRTLHELVELKPLTHADLLAVSGIGAKKAERFGEGMLEVIRGHLGR